MLDIEKFVGGLHDYLEKSLSPIVARIKALEDRQPEKGEKGDSGNNGIDGKDGVNGKDGLEGKEGPQGVQGIQGEKGKDGKDGADGKDADPNIVVDLVIGKLLSSNEFLNNVVEISTAKIMSQVKNGEPGKDGNDGENGKDGKDADENVIIERVLSLIPAPKDGLSVTVDDVAPMIDEIVSKRVSELPVKHGENGKDADESAIIEKILEKIRVPEDGKSLTLDDVSPVLDVAVSKWAVDFERRAHDVLQAAVERFPKPKDGEKGETGQDGFGIQEFVQRGDRTVVAIYKRGDEVVEQEFTFPAVIDRGVYKAGSAYEKGDGATYAGSYWIAQRDNKEAPGNSDAWRLAVKRGRDGKDA